MVATYEGIDEMLFDYSLFLHSLYRERDTCKKFCNK